MTTFTPYYSLVWADPDEMRKSYRGPSKDKILLYLTKWYPKFLEIDQPVTSLLMDQDKMSNFYI